VCEIVFDVFAALKAVPNPAEANCLYTGLATDTNFFKNSNVTADSYLCASKLVALGAKPNEVARQITCNETERSLKFLAYAVLKMELFCEGRFAVIAIEDKVFNKFRIKARATTGIIDYALKIKGVEVACLLKPESAERTNLSFRSIKRFNLLPIVKKLGGGGHKNAAGASIDEKLSETKKYIVSVFRDLK
jgi:phosphoesterase RecJ-like protein